MRYPMIIASTALLAIGAGPATAGRHDSVPEAIEDGKPISCIALNRIRSSHVRSDKVIDFEMSGGKVYRNTLPFSCPQLGYEQRFLYRTSIGQLCSVDTITVLQSPGLQEGPSCGLGEFQPVKLIKKAGKAN